jgi:protocatechuate 3,4-dioxygenase, beta subunit
MKTPIARRSALQLSVFTASAVALPALLLRPAVAQTPRRLTPSQSEGPFYPDQALADADADLLKNGNVAYGGGQPAWVSGVVSDPISGS